MYYTFSGPSDVGHGDLEANPTLVLEVSGESLSLQKSPEAHSQPIWETSKKRVADPSYGHAPLHSWGGAVLFSARSPSAEEMPLFLSERRQSGPWDALGRIRSAVPSLAGQAWASRSLPVQMGLCADFVTVVQAAL